MFGGVGVRLTPLQGGVRPYLAVGPLLAVLLCRGPLSGFAAAGLEAAIAGLISAGWQFVEGRAMQGGGSWTQLVGGVRAAIR